GALQPRRRARQPAEPLREHGCRARRPPTREGFGVGARRDRRRGPRRALRANPRPLSSSPVVHRPVARRTVGTRKAAATVVRVRILVTNDDGVDSPGIHALAAMLVADGHDVLVVAPTDDRSGAGASIGRLYGSGPPPVERRVWDALPELSVYAIDAPPAT